MALVVVADPAERATAALSLTVAGFTVWEAADGRGGLARIAEGPDLVIVDEELPDGSGLELCRRLKQGPETEVLSLLHISAAGVDVTPEGLEHGADGYLTHPLDPAVLVATARALLRLRRAKDALRRALARSELLAGVSARFSDARTPRQVVAVVADHVRDQIGARSATMYRLDADEGGLELLHTTQPQRVARRFGWVSLDDAIPSAVVARTGRPLFGASAEELGRDFPDLVSAHRASGGGAWAVVPLVSYGQLVGVLVMTFLADGELRADLRELLVALGERCGQALERAMLQDTQRRIAATLQAGLLPAELPEVPGVTFGARYLAGTEGMTVGGDFYDVFGREHDWIAIIGDVCGRGAEAAGLTGLARHTVRAEARHVRRPGAILEALNDASRHPDTNPHHRFLTAACLTLRPQAGGVAVRAGVAGHPPPLIVRASGDVTELPLGGPMIGVMDDVHVPDVDVRLQPGDTLVLYTDGVTEARRGVDFWGEARLTRLLGELAVEGTDAQGIADAVVDAAQIHGGAVDDDMAVLAIRAG